MGFTFDPAFGQYRDSAGRLVSDATIRKALDQVLDAQSAAARDTTQRLLDGTISLAVWQATMMQQIKTVHLIGTAVAVGGWDRMGYEWTGWAGSQIKPQYQWLARFTYEVSTGVQKLDGTVLARAALYISAARSTHREAQRRLAAQRIVGEERRVLGVADHCRTCIQQARLGWQAFGTLKRIGDSECRTNCRCHFEFRAAPALAA